MADGKGKRFNSGKTRYELIPPYATEQCAKVLTMGAEKYGDNNWRRGMKWTTVLASLERHLQAIKKGEDYDKESGLLHSAHIMCNAGFLTEYYKIYGQGDDRQHSYLNIPKIGLCIDDFDIKPDEIPFTPHCYIAEDDPNNDIHKACLEEWLLNNGFPMAPVYITENKSKLEIVKEADIDIIVDTKIRDFIELNRGGVCCYLFDTPDNRHYDVGHKRIHKLLELI